MSATPAFAVSASAPIFAFGVTMMSMTATMAVTVATWTALGGIEAGGIVTMAASFATATAVFGALCIVVVASREIFPGTCRSMRPEERREGGFHFDISKDDFEKIYR